MIQFRELLGALHANDVAFVIVGGLAASLHGSARQTYDVDILYDRSRENLERLVTALTPFEPYLRGAPPGLPFTFDAETLRRGLNFTLTTTHGPLDVLGEISGIGDYAAARKNAITAEMFGHAYAVLSLEDLITAKKAAGRPKDLETLAELRTIGEERKSR